MTIEQELAPFVKAYVTAKLEYSHKIVNEGAKNCTQEEIDKLVVNLKTAEAKLLCKTASVVGVE